MEKNQLLYVLETARCGSVTRAAEKLHLSQPSLSNQIIQLEQELGIPLFERSHKRVTPTSAGEFLSTKRSASSATWVPCSSRWKRCPTRPAAVCGWVS